MPGLPRLALISEVPPLSLSAGPAVLYRLLSSYPVDRLLLCLETGNQRYADHELEGPQRVEIPFGWRRLQYSRFGRWHGTLALLFQPLLARRFARHLRKFRAEAVLCVAHGTVWWPAWLAARRLNLPFHLIVHDHWRACYDAHAWTDGFAERRFAKVYRTATSRLLVSGAMAANYRQRYGGETFTLLYPSQLPGTEAHARPPERAPGRPFIFAYAGGMDGQWSRDAIVALAHAVSPLGAVVRVYQNVSLADIQAAGLRTTNVEIVPFLPARELHRQLRASVDVMYLPMSFSAADRSNVEVCFPSKLADYTVPGLPILVRAPAYSSVAAWLATHPQAAHAVFTEDASALADAAGALMADANLRAQLGAAALAAGRECFAADRVFATFAGILGEKHPLAS
jgi:hypothetical protein